MTRRIAVALVIISAACVAQGGPPFATDDPAPVDYQHWEIYLASQVAHDSGGWSGTAPHMEVNYGAISNLQLHLIAPLAFVAPSHASTQFGYGDTELGAKFRFVGETDLRPQIGIFPLLEAPSGDSNRGLGSGHTDIFLPLWVQKSFGPWETYGGGGYWINPGSGNRDWWLVGWLLQRQVTSALTIGAEVFYETAQEDGGEPGTRYNAGAIYDFSETYHLLLSAGQAIQGPSGFQAYAAFQVTFGPETSSAASGN
jgi:hypothetical protein